MIGSTEKLIHFVGKSVVGGLAVLLLLCIGYNVHRIRELKRLRVELTTLSADIDDAMEENKPQPIEQPKFVEQIRNDWDNPGKHMGLRRGVFYP